MGAADQVAEMEREGERARSRRGSERQPQGLLRRAPAPAPAAQPHFTPAVRTLSGRLPTLRRFNLIHGFPSSKGGLGVDQMEEEEREVRRRFPRTVFRPRWRRARRHAGSLRVASGGAGARRGRMGGRGAAIAE
jgi:hypothetical protein